MLVEGDQVAGDGFQAGAVAGADEDVGPVDNCIRCKRADLAPEDSCKLGMILGENPLRRRLNSDGAPDGFG